MISKPFNPSTVICRSLPGLVLTLHLLLLFVLSHVSPPDGQAFAALCLAWPFAVPIALGFNFAAIVHIFGANGGTNSGRRVSLAFAALSFVGTITCGFAVLSFGRAVNGLGN